MRELGEPNRTTSLSLPFLFLRRSKKLQLLALLPPPPPFTSLPAACVQLPLPQSNCLKEAKPFASSFDRRESIEQQKKKKKKMPEKSVAVEPPSIAHPWHDLSPGDEFPKSEWLRQERES